MNPVYSGPVAPSSPLTYGYGGFGSLGGYSFPSSSQYAQSQYNQYLQRNSLGKFLGLQNEADSTAVHHNGTNKSKGISCRKNASWFHYFQGSPPSIAFTAHHCPLCRRQQARTHAISYTLFNRAYVEFQPGATTLSLSLAHFL